MSLVSSEAFVRYSWYRLSRFARAGLRDNLETVHRKARSGLQRIQAVRGDGQPGDSEPPRALEGQRRYVRDAYTRAIAGYVPRPYRGEITVFLAEDDPAELPTDATWGWSKVSRAVEVHTVPGDHLTCLTKHIDASRAPAPSVSAAGGAGIAAGSPERRARPRR